MPELTVADLRLRYELEGRPEGPVVVLSHSLGADLSMWDPQAAALAARFRVLRYDLRGHGGTVATPGPHTIARLGEDVVRLLDALGVARAHFCGLSIGGLVGMWLGAHAAGRIERLVLCNTGARIGTHESWNARIESVRQGGMGKVAQPVIERWFTPAFRERSPDVVARVREQLEATPVEGYVGGCTAIRDADLTADLAAIRAPTLVVAGAHDPATTPALGRLVADAIPGARYVELPAAHLSNLEAAEAFTAAVSSFLGGTGGG
ncbi:MAG: 3-oxoadipate enol-lactonase [Burkholderiales bacterium]|jgi:3-oxoadipate enol-lactonase